MADSERSQRRSWQQRLTIAALAVLGVVSLFTAGGLAAGQWVISSRNLVALSEQAPPTAPTAATSLIGVDEDVTETTEPEPFPIIEPDAKNFLITGSDNNDCIDPDSRFAGAFGDRSGFGERSDTIMVWRVNPGTNQAAILSFPRDLYVDIAGGGRSRINSAYRRDDPSRLRDTIYDNFGIPIDHFIQVDFCAFKTMVDAVGGVAVPFEYPARDTSSGLDVPVAGCYVFDGEHALAYVRSSYYEYEDPADSGNWRRDGTSDLGRIARQQDFLRRTVASVLASGAYSPGVVRGLIETNADYVTVDSNLTVNRLLQFAGVLQYLDPGEITSYQIESTPRTISGNSVLVPRLDTENMQEILALFRGEATLANAPEQVLSATTLPMERPGPTTTTTTTTTTVPATTTTAGPTAEELDRLEGLSPEQIAALEALEQTAATTTAPATTTTTPTTTTTTTTTTLPEVDPDENLLGISPPRGVEC